jgi:hypothetical protein
MRFYPEDGGSRLGNSSVAAQLAASTIRAQLDGVSLYIHTVKPQKGIISAELNCH